MDPERRFGSQPTHLSYKIQEGYLQIRTAWSREKQQALVLENLVWIPASILMRWKILAKVITSLSLSLAICKRGSMRPTSYYVEKDLLMAIILIMTFTEHRRCIHDASQPVCGVRCRRYPHFWMSKLRLKSLEVGLSDGKAMPLTISW